ncbi:MAG TPA: pitrilysin family protein [Vicinamibacterales bacterium]|jgi:zinc protease|nr:pitrilysin family protein [Vicinamibacterales bacterium]
MESNRHRRIASCHRLGIARGFVLLLFIALVPISISSQAPGERATDKDVTRATLDNGLRVVLIRDPLAPVVTVEDNYLVGANETPANFPGSAHALEHMLFRGCAGLSADQTAAIFAQLGGYGNADTQQNITQYFTTVPAADVEVALRVDAACMQDADNSQEEWAKEKGAIEQEVARDLSEPTYKFLTRLNEDMFAGTPYAHDALGTRESFEATTGDMLKTFYKTWYAPNNAILVVAGDIDPTVTLAKIRELYGKIERRTIGTRPDVVLPPVKQDTFTIESNLPYALAFLAYRLPGTDSADFAAARILSDVLASQRGDLYALVPAGKALDAQFELSETYPKASVGFAVAALPAGTNPSGIVSAMRSIVTDSARSGLSEELIEAAKRSEIASAEFQRNSIPDLAATWSQALAAEGRSSPDEDIEAIRRVTAADVNRVAARFLTAENSITATLVPKPSGEPVASKGFGGGEQLTSAPTKPVTLPEWAQSALSSLQVPRLTATWTDTVLPNKVRLIVRTERTSPTVTVLGNVRHEPDLQAPRGKDGVADVLGELFSYGTTHLDRLAFQKALDDIAANETAGYDFSVRVLKNDFSRGVELLADNVLHPALPSEAFEVVKKQTAEFVEGRMKSPGHRADRALRTALLPQNDPALREATAQTVSKLTLDDVRRFHAATFRPDVTTIVVIGDVTPEEAKTTIARWFGGWKALGNKPELDLPRVPPNGAAEVTVPDSSAVQSSVVLAQEVGLTRFDPDYYALQIGNHVLGGGFYATRLYHDLRQEAGLVYTVDDSLTANRTRSVYSVTYGCDPENVSKARELIDRDLRAMQTDNVTPQELQQAKALLLRQMPLRESSEDAVAGSLLARAQIGLPLEEPTRAAERYFTMGADDVRAAFKKWIRPDGFVRVVRAPAQ